MSCRLEDEDFILAPQDKGEPPSWVPALRGKRVVWVDRKLFEQIKKRRHEKPCEICPDNIKTNCSFHKERAEQK